MKLYLTEQDFMRFFFFGGGRRGGDRFCLKNEKMGQIWAKNRVFRIYLKVWCLNFCLFIYLFIYLVFQFGLWLKFILFITFLHKSHIWEKSGFWYMGEVALGQSDCRILKLTTYYISRTKWWNNLIFYVLLQIYGN